MSQSQANSHKSQYGNIDYEIRLDYVQEFCSKEVNIDLQDRAIPVLRDGAWNDLYLSGLYRYGLMLTQQKAYTLMGDKRYPGGIPVVAPRPTPDEPNLWPPETWIIYRD